MQKVSIAQAGIRELAESAANQSLQLPGDHFKNRTSRSQMR